jgi:hypothetical protein
MSDETHDRTHEQTEPEGPPPVGGSWKVLYAVVLLNLALLVVLFHLFTRALR